LFDPVGAPVKTKQESLARTVGVTTGPATAQ
jgi:hypothetical protein